MKLVSLVLLFLLPAGLARGADLAELQRMALENRQVIQRYEANLAKSIKGEAIARGGYYPSLDVSYSMNRLDEAADYEGRENSVAYGAVSWNLFAGFRDRYGIESAALLRAVEDYRLRSIRQDIALNVALAYLAIYNRQANLQVTEDSYNTLLKLYEDAENRFKVGLINKSELLKFKVDLDNAVLTRKKAGAELNKSVLRLEREIGADASLDQLAFTEFAELPGVAAYPELAKVMLAKRSELKALEEAARISALQVRAEQALYYPRIDLVGSYSRYDDDYLNGNGDNGSEELRAKLVLSMNLFDGFVRESRIGQARVEERAARYDLEELRAELETGLETLVLDYGVNAENVSVAAGSIEQAEENLRVTRLSYKEGVGTESELLDAISSLSRARFNYVAAKSAAFGGYFQITRAVEGF